MSGLTELLAREPTLRQIAEQVPLGYECRSCGASAYNWLSKAGRYCETGETCCPAMRNWIERARTPATGGKP